MKKCDLLALIEACQDKLNSLYNDNLSNDVKEELKRILEITVKHYNIVKETDESNYVLLNNYAESYTNLYYTILNNNEKALEKNETGLSIYSQLDKIDNKQMLANPTEVNRIIDIDAQSVDNKKKSKSLLKIIASTSSVILAIAIIATLAKENNRLKNEIDSLEDDLGYKNTIIETLQENNNEENNIVLDINNEESVYNYAQSLQELLPENTLTTEDIINCLKLANFDELLNQSVFSSREELYDTISKLGTLVKYAGTEKTVIENKNTDIYFSEDELKDMIKCITNNELAISNFDSFKSEKGYNSYKVYEYCSKMFKDGNNKDKVLYAKLFNEITARKFESFSVTPDSPLSTYYLMLGMFNENKDYITALTANRNWGPIYGNMKNDSSVPNGYTGDKIDGTYGFICIEELIDHLTIGNPNYSFYSIYADEFMIDKGLSR